MSKRKIGDEMLTAQRNEITEHVIYSKLAESIKDAQSRSILKRLSEDGRRHYDLWKKQSRVIIFS